MGVKTKNIWIIHIGNVKRNDYSPKNFLDIRTWKGDLQRENVELSHGGNGIHHIFMITFMFQSDMPYVPFLLGYIF